MLLDPITTFVQGLDTLRKTGLPLIFLIRWYTPTRYKYGHSTLSTTFPKTIPRLVQEVLRDGRERSVIKHHSIEKYVKNVENKEV